MGHEESTIGALLEGTGGSIKTGPFGTKLRASEYTPTGVPVISVGEVGFGRLRIHDDTPRVDETVLSRMPEFLLKAGDIVFGRKGAVERSAQVQPDEDGYFLGSDGIRIRLNVEECDPRFIAYQLQTTAHRSWMHQHAAGTTMPSLNEGIIRRIPIILKPLREQRAIAAMLGALDDKIELNRRMNAALEAMARALFQSWFVDFDPVRAKLDGRQPPGLDPATAALFPASLQNSVLGRIPKGWVTIPLYGTARWVNGAAFRNEDFCEPGEGLPVIKIAELKDGIGPQTKWSKRPTEPDRMIDTGDLLYSWSGSPDSSLEAFLWDGGPGLLNQHIFKVITPSPSQKRFVYYLLHHLRPVLVETARNKQTTGLGHVTVADMRRLMVCSPCEAVLNAFDQSVAPLFEAAFGNSLQSRTLAALRDTLLPRLLSGELSVAAAMEELNGRLRPGEVSSARVAWP